jgi:hypothetical protein
MSVTEFYQRRHYFSIAIRVVLIAGQVYLLSKFGLKRYTKSINSMRTLRKTNL